LSPQQNGDLLVCTPQLCSEPDTTNYMADPELECRFVVTIHDLTRLLVPDACTDEEFVARYGAAELKLLRRQYGIVGPQVFRQHFDGLTRYLARHAERVATVSRSTARDLMAHLAVERERISIVPSAVCDRFTPRGPTAVGRTLRRFGIDSPYFICAGLAGTHKRLVWLLETFADLTRRTDCEIRLVVAGGDAERRPDVRSAVTATGDPERVIFTGYTTDDELAELYSGAVAFLSASRSEGFSLPPAEALACGVSSIVTDIPAHREVLRDAAHFYPVGDRETLVALMSRALVRDLPGRSARYDPPRWPAASAAFVGTLRSLL
jgi:glycosyltransferase involved in cell wall biosynthesis